MMLNTAKVKFTGPCTRVTQRPSKHDIEPASSILAHRLRRWPNIKPGLSEYLMFAMDIQCWLTVGPPSATLAQ